MAFDICHGLEEQNWENMDPGERFDFLRQMIEQSLNDWHYEQVNVVAGTAPDGAEMYYDRETKSLVIDVDKVGADDYSGFDGVSLGIHEVLHAMDDQDFGGSYDYFGDQSQSVVHNALHQTALAWTTERQEECFQQGQSSESPPDKTLPPINWGL